MGNQGEWTKGEINGFQTAVISWFELEGRHELPWRQTRDPYAVMVSELMLQQTQVATVLKRGFFENWMEKFPDVESLAQSDEPAILKAWEGLGYYNRARNLQKAAKAIVEKHGGVFPTEFADILELPGVGRYTAGAVYSCALEKSAPVVDGNVFRIFSRVFGYLDPVDTTAGGRQMWGWAEMLVPVHKAREFNSGLMEIGQRLCRKTNPECEACPLKAHCVGFKTGLVLADLPVKKNRQKLEAKTERVVFYKNGNEVWLNQEAGKRRKGLWRLPEVTESESEGLSEIFRMNYGITKYRVELVVLRGKGEVPEVGGESGEWFAVPDQTREIAMAAPYRKALERLRENEFDPEKWSLNG